MRTSAMLIGIVGGLMGLVIGVLGYLMGSAAAEVDATAGTLIKVISVVVPLAGLVGAFLVRGRPLLGGLLMIASAVAFAVIFQFGTFGYITVALLAVAGVLGLAGMRGRPAAA